MFGKGMEGMILSFLDRPEIKGFVEWAKTNIPVAIRQFNEMIERQKRIEEKLDKLLNQ